MCLLFVDAEELDSQYPEVKMADPWDSLKDEILALLRDGAQEISSYLKPAATSFMEDVAIQAAREKWNAIHATSDEDRALHESNLRHLEGQAKAEIARLKLATTSWAEAILKKTLEVGLGAVSRFGPRIFGV